MYKQIALAQHHDHLCTGGLGHHWVSLDTRAWQSQAGKFVVHRNLTSKPLLAMEGIDKSGWLADGDPFSLNCRLSRLHLVGSRVQHEGRRPQRACIGCVVPEALPGLEGSSPLRNHQQHRPSAGCARHARPAVLQAHVEVGEGELVSHLVQGQPIPPPLKANSQ